MLDQNILIFALVAALGLLILLFGFKFSERTRKVVETIGAIVFHVGVFGILYYKVNFSIFISLVALVLSLFILIDPLKIGSYLNTKIFRLTGFIFLFASVAFSLQYFSGFPVWMWGIPLLVYLLPYLIHPLKKYLRTILFIAWVVVLAYVAVIGYAVYIRYYPQASLKIMSKYVPFTLSSKKPTDGQENTASVQQPSTTTATQPQMTEGPYFNSLKQADDRFIKLQQDHRELMVKYEILLKENLSLKEEIVKLKEGQVGTLQ